MAEQIMKKVNKRARWRARLDYAKVLPAFMAFFAPFALMLIIVIGNEIYPFGKRSFLFSDMYHQYMPFLQEMVAKVRAGEGIDYSWNVGLGSNFLALYVYYLASPVNWLVFLFPASHVMEFMTYAIVVKIGLSGLTAYTYLKSRQTKGSSLTDSYGALVCSVFYAMSGFVAAYNWNVMWMDCIVLAPLIVMGLERLVREGKMQLYVITLALSIYTNFYISIMICLFLVLYYVLLFFTEKKSWGMIWKFAAGSLLAAGLAGILLVPAVQALRATDFGDVSFPKKVEAYYSILDVVARHSVAITTERALEHWPNIYCGTIVFLLIPLYVTNEKIPARKRFGFLALAGVFLISFSVNLLDFIWHGFNYPDSLPARQSFLYVLIILTACHDCFYHRDGLKKDSIVKVFLGATLFLLCIEKFVEVTDFVAWTWYVNFGFILIYAICLYLFLAKDRKAVKITVAVLGLVAVLGETALNMAYTSVGTTDRKAYLKNVSDYKALYERNVKSEEGFYRAEKFTRKTKNDAVLAGFPSASIFSSTMNSLVMDFYTSMGMQHSKVYYGYDGASPFAAALLNVGYMFGESDEWENELWQLVDEQNGIYLYKARYTLPFGYVVPKDFDLQEDVNDKGVTVQNNMVKSLGREDYLLARKSSKEDGDNVEFTADEAGIYYGMVNRAGTAKINIGGIEEKERKLKDLKSGTMFYVGYLQEGQTITMKNGDSEDKTPKISVSMYQVNVDVLKSALDVLGKTHMEDVRVNNTEVSGKLSMEEEGKLVLSIPYDKGWTVWVNGEETEPDMFGGAFLALNLEPGDYEIKLHYVPVGRTAGILLSLISICLGSVGLWLSGRRKERHEPENGAGMPVDK